MKPDFNWDDARIFLAIARAGTLSGAADAMNMGVATVSRRLDRLEKMLGMPLFSGHQNGYRLTDDGEIMLERAEAQWISRILWHVRTGFAACRKKSARIRLYGWSCTPILPVRGGSG